MRIKSGQQGFKWVQHVVTERQVVYNPMVEANSLIGDKTNTYMYMDIIYIYTYIYI